MASKDAKDEENEVLNNAPSGQEPKVTIGLDIDEKFEEALDKIKEVVALKETVEAIDQMMQRIERNLNDQRSTSIKVGTGTRHECKIYIDPTKPKEARNIIETTIDNLELAQDEIEQKVAERKAENGNGD